MTRPIFICLSLVFFILSCNRPEFTSSPVKIAIQVPGKLQKMDFNQYFDSSKVVALETTNSSLISNVNRIVVYRNKYYVFDKNLASVFVFGPDGKYINKFSHPGKGVGNYISLVDFTIDQKNDRVVLLADRPGKLLSFKLTGEFVSEKELSGFHRYISSSVDRLFTYQNNGADEKLIESFNLDFGDQRGFLSPDSRSELFQNFAAVYPVPLRSKAVYFSMPFTNIIYKNKGSEIVPAYELDFGVANTPDSLFTKDLTAAEIYHSAMKANYGFFVSNFRETSGYLIFTFGRNTIVMYSKKNKKAAVFRFVHNSESLINFENLFGHDGQDDNIMAIKTAADFKIQIAAYRENAQSWNKLPGYLKQIDNNLSMSSNPLLVIYHIKPETN